MNAAQIEHIKLSSYYIPGLVESETKGLMVEMLKAIEQETNIRFELTLMPTARVQHSFLVGKTYGYFPELEDFRPPESCRTVSFMQKKIVAFTRKDSLPIKAVADLEGKKVGAVTGYSYGINIINNSKINLQRVANEQANIKKLLSGRIDVVVGDLDSTVNAINELKMEDQIHFDPAQPIDLLDVYFVFPSHDDGKLHCEMVSNGIEKLRKRGALLVWFGYQ